MHNKLLNFIFIFIPDNINTQNKPSAAKQTEIQFEEPEEENPFGDIKPEDDYEIF